MSELGCCGECLMECGLGSTRVCFSCAQASAKNIESLQQQSTALQQQVKDLNLNHGLLEVHSSHTDRLLTSCETALASRDEKIESLQKQVKALQAENEQWESLHSNSLYGTMGELKATAIREAMHGAPCNNESHDEVHRYIEEYANTLSNKEGD